MGSGMRMKIRSVGVACARVATKQQPARASRTVKLQQHEPVRRLMSGRVRYAAEAATNSVSSSLTPITWRRCSCSSGVQKASAEAMLAPKQHQIHSRLIRSIASISACVSAATALDASGTSTKSVTLTPCASTSPPIGSSVAALAARLQLASDTNGVSVGGDGGADGGADGGGSCGRGCNTPDESNAGGILPFILPTAVAGSNRVSFNQPSARIGIRTHARQQAAARGAGSDPKKYSQRMCAVG